MQYTKEKSIFLQCFAKNRKTYIIIRLLCRFCAIAMSPPSTVMSSALDLWSLATERTQEVETSPCSFVNERRPF